MFAILSACKSGPEQPATISIGIIQPDESSPLSFDNGSFVYEVDEVYLSIYSIELHQCGAPTIKAQVDSLANITPDSVDLHRHIMTPEILSVIHQAAGEYCMGSLIFLSNGENENSEDIRSSKKNHTGLIRGRFRKLGATEWAPFERVVQLPGSYMFDLHNEKGGPLGLDAGSTRRILIEFRWSYLNAHAFFPDDPRFAKSLVSNVIKKIQMRAKQ